MTTGLANTELANTGLANTELATAELAIEAAGLARSYGSTSVLRGIDLRVPRGGVFALLGPNGAGKPATEVLDSSSA